MTPEKGISTYIRLRTWLLVSAHGDTAVAEIASHEGQARYVIRYRMRLSEMKVLDLTDPAERLRWSYTQDVARRARATDYRETQQIAERARQQGYDAIKFPSEARGASGRTNYVILSERVNEFLDPMGIAPVPR